MKRSIVMLPVLDSNDRFEFAVIIMLASPVSGKGDVVSQSTLLTGCHGSVPSTSTVNENISVLFSNIPSRWTEDGVTDITVTLPGGGGLNWLYVFIENKKTYNNYYYIFSHY